MPIKINVDLLRPHPRNKEFFDDMEGDKWKDFVESIKTSGIIQPLIVTDDYVVISGHQRLKAAKELGLTEVPCEVHEYVDKDGITAEDWKLKDLLESNLMQRGIGNINPMKSARCIGELKRIYNIKKGGDKKSILVNSSYQTDTVSDRYEIIGSESNTVSDSFKTVKELADNLGISERHLRRLDKLNNLIPPFQNLIEFGSDKNNLPLQLAEFLASRSKEEQEELYKTFGNAIGSYTKEEIVNYKKEIETYKNELKKLEKEKTELEEAKTELEEELKNAIPKDYEEIKQALKDAEIRFKELQSRINYLEEQKKNLMNQPPQIIEKVVEPSDYKSLKEQTEKYKEQYKKLYDEYKAKEQELEAFKHHIEDLHNANPVELLDIVDFKYTINKFLKDVTPLIYLGEQFAKLNKNEKEKWLEQIETVQRWIDDVKQAIDGNVKGTNIIYLERKDDVK